MKPCILVLCEAPVVRRVAGILAVQDMTLQILVKTGEAQRRAPAGIIWHPVH